MSNQSVVLDANVMVGLIDINDKWHQRAKTLIKYQENLGRPFVYYDFIASETISVLARRLLEQKRVADFDRAFNEFYKFSSPRDIAFRSHRVAELYSDILITLAHYKGALNFNDILMTLIMAEEGLTHLLSFDKRFDLVSSIKRLC